MAAATDASPALAARTASHWVRIQAPGSDELWYDRNKLVLTGSDITFWRRVNFAIPQQFRAFRVSTALYREQINCDEHTMRVHAHMFQSVDGIVVEHVNYSATEAVPIVPDTVGDALWRALCPIVRERSAIDAELKAAEERLDNRRRELDRLRAEVEDLTASVARLRTEATGAGRVRSSNGGAGAAPAKRLPSAEPFAGPAAKPALESGRQAPHELSPNAPSQPGRQGI